MSVLSVKDYLRKNPEATLADYDKYVDETRAHENKIELERQKSYDDWVESKIGSYFLMNFNGSSKMVFELAYKPNYGRSSKDLIAKNAYEFYEDKSCTKLAIEKGRPINELWLPNPYSNRPYCQCHQGIYELTKEEFDKYVSIFENLKKMNDECLNIFSQIKEIRK